MRHGHPGSATDQGWRGGRRRHAAGFERPPERGCSLETCRRRRESFGRQRAGPADVRSKRSGLTDEPTLELPDLQRSDQIYQRALPATRSCRSLCPWSRQDRPSGSRSPPSPRTSRRNTRSHQPSDTASRNSRRAARRWARAGTGSAAAYPRMVVNGVPRKLARSRASRPLHRTAP